MDENGFWCFIILYFWLLVFRPGHKTKCHCLQLKLIQLLTDESLVKDFLFVSLPVLIVINQKTLMVHLACVEPQDTGRLLEAIFFFSWGKHNNGHN